MCVRTIDLHKCTYVCTICMYTISYLVRNNIHIATVMSFCSSRVIPQIWRPCHYQIPCCCIKRCPQTKAPWMYVFVSMHACMCVRTYRMRDVVSVVIRFFSFCTNWVSASSSLASFWWCMVACAWKLVHPATTHAGQCKKSFLHTLQNHHTPQWHVGDLFR